MPSSGCDCLVIGGGPAGAALAGLLAGSGHRIVLVDDGRDRRAMPEETLLPASLQVLERLGLLAAVQDGAFSARLRHGALWGSPDLVWQPDGEAGLREPRGAFDAALRAWARGRGVVTLEGHCVPGPLPRSGRIFHKCGI